MSDQDSESLTRHCWECLRREIVCDAAYPVCQMCINNGIVCPGYDNMRPLRWLTPGKVTSRTRKKSIRPSTCLDGTVPSSIGDYETSRTPGKAQRGRSKMLAKTASEGKFPSPSRKTLSVELDAILEATQYFNTEIYQNYAATHQLAPSPWLTLVPMDTIIYLPPSIQDTLVFMAIGHRISQLPEVTDRIALSVLRTRMYDHRGKAIREIHHVLDNERLRNTDYALLIVLMLLFGEWRQTVSPDWTQHFEGASKMIELRGGLEAFLSHPFLRSLIDYFLIVGVIANTTSPSSAQLRLASQSSSLADIIPEYYGNGLFPVLLCPPALFAETIRINDLRAQAASHPKASESTSLEHGSSEILQRLLDFSPEAWADANKETHHGDHRISSLWLLLGRIYQSTLVLYCISSLQALSILAHSDELEAVRSMHRERLVSYLEKALGSPEIKMWMMWPLVVAGMEASSESVRGFVREKLRKMVWDLGTPLPLVATAALDRFWQCGRRRWDECFDRPFAFVT